MKHKFIIATVFVIMVVAQLFIPAQMILERENVLNTGHSFKFKTAPVDPYDPFRGKYVTLNYSETNFYVDDSTWNGQGKAYVLIKEDDEGFASISDVVREEPSETQDFIYCDIRYNTWNEPHYISVEYPFDRFYMEESKAQEAETFVRQFAIDSNEVTYAMVSIKDGQAVIKDVYIGDKPIKDYVIDKRLEQ